MGRGKGEIEYSEVHAVKKYTVGNNKLKLKSFFVNARRLKDNFKIDELEEYVLDYKLDTICIVETLNDSAFNGEIAIKDYTIYQKDMVHAKEGRMAFYCTL